MDSSDVTQLIILLILLMLSAFFSSAETALTTCNKIRMRSLAEDGNRRAGTVMTITENSGKMLSAILIGNNIVNTAAASLATALAYSFGGSFVALASGIITVLILIFGEITPKTMASIHAEKIALFYAPMISLFMKIMTPVIFIINSLSMGILFLLHVDPKAKSNVITETELRTMVDVSHEEGGIESEEKEMIHNVFDFGDANAKDVMVPRVNVTFIDVDSTYDEVIEIFSEDKHTRFPVYEETTDNIVGIINVKDLLLYRNREDFSLRDILRDVHFTYEYKNTSELLLEMRQASFNIAIVLDEYGETAGLITLEDLLEEIVGEIHDEYDENEEEFIVEINKLEYVIEGSINLEDVNDRLDLELSSEDYDSLGGLVIEYLDGFPDEGDEVITKEGIRLVVDKMDKNRIEKIHVYLPEPTEDTEEDA